MVHHSVIEIVYANILILIVHVGKLKGDNNSSHAYTNYKPLRYLLFLQTNGSVKHNKLYNTQPLYKGHHLCTYSRIFYMLHTCMCVVSYPPSFLLCIFSHVLYSLLHDLDSVLKSTLRFITTLYKSCIYIKIFKSYDYLILLTLSGVQVTSLELHPRAFRCEA